MLVIKRLLKKIMGNKAVSLYASFIQRYRYRIELVQANRFEKVYIFFDCLRLFFINKKIILFYPDGPRDFHAIYKIIELLGYHITTDPIKKYDIAIQWWLAFDGNPYAPPQKLTDVIDPNRNEIEVLNIKGNDISKKLVGAVFEEVFGYSLDVDPRTYVGKCVKKLNWNALHKGEVIDCPIEPNDNDEDVVYQRLVRNETDDGAVEDIRIPIFKSSIPFVYLKYRKVENRLVDRLHTNTKAIIAEVDDLLAKEEIEKICLFANKMGLDYCEVDVLRDRDSGLIYIVDANNTPSGPPSPISEADGRDAVKRLATAFREIFVK